MDAGRRLCSYVYATVAKTTLAFIVLMQSALVVVDKERAIVQVGGSGRRFYLCLFPVTVTGVIVSMVR